MIDKSEDSLELLAAAAVSGVFQSEAHTGLEISARIVVYEEVAALIGASVDPVEVPSSLKGQILSHAARLGATIGKGDVPVAVKTGTDEGWRRHAVPGVRYKELAQQDDKSVLLLLEIAAGVKYPGHVHHGSERCLVVSGSFFFDDRKFVQGDFIDAPAGSTDPVLYTPEGTTLLLVVDRHDYLH